MIEDELKLRDAAYWEAIWEQSKMDGHKPGSDGPANSVDLWEKRADQFKSTAKGERGKKRTAEVLCWLESQGVCFEGLKILDIGAGPGAYSFAFAEKNAEVTALEPTTGMSSFIKEQIQNEAKVGVTVVQMAWEDVDVEKMGWTQAFDLVFISMCPGVHNVTLFKKAMTCSKKYVYYSGWAGRRDSEAFGELWKELYGDETPIWRSDIIYNLNWLYTQEYDLAFDVQREARSEELSLESAVEEFIARLSFYGKDTTQVKKAVEQFVKNKSENGILKTKAISRRGKILVKL